mmetsp:Transcript_3866/g.9407  ORF Transcript_3866/g.9407 Transcript_3866/m.9407 type:complete len:518 (-) Transcript_3866:1440-2993(-)
MVPQLSVKWSGVKAPVGPGGRITKRTRTLSKDSRRGTAVALDQKVFCIQLSPSNKTVAVSYADGEIRLFDFGTGQNTAVVNPIVKGFAQKQVDFVDAVCEEKMRFPITSLRWKDDSVLISVSPSDDGLVQFWDCSAGYTKKVGASSTKTTGSTPSTTSGGQHHFASPPPERELSRIVEDNNATQVLDFARKGRSFATGGSDARIRVYDASYSRYGSLKLTFENRSETHPVGHSAPIVALRFHNTDVNLLVSCGMDSLVHLWDLLQEAPVKQLYGPTVGADGVDYGFHGLELVTGSYDPRKCIQIWDMKPSSSSAALVGGGGPEDLIDVRGKKSPSKDKKSDAVAVVRGAARGGGSSSFADHAATDEDDMPLALQIQFPKDLEMTPATEVVDGEALEPLLTKNVNQLGVQTVCFSGRANYLIASSRDELRVIERKSGKPVAAYAHDPLPSDGAGAPPPNGDAPNAPRSPAAAVANTITTIHLDTECDNLLIGDADGIMNPGPGGPSGVSRQVVSEIQT